MKLLLTATVDNRLIRILKRYVRQSRAADFSMVDSPEEADVIVFAETVDWRDPQVNRVRRHRLFRQYRHKCVLYTEADRSQARLPAVAVNALPVPWQIGIGSLPINEIQRPIDRALALPTELMSFVGSRSSHVRTRILDRYADTHECVIDTDSFDAWNTTSAERIRQRRTFETALSAATFTLCPKGMGTTSLRLYEAMQAGRCPVILADEWVEDAGVDWSFALRVAESDFDKLEEILAAVPLEEALQRGAQGRKAWEAACSPQRYLSTLAVAALELVERNVRIPLRTPAQVTEDSLYNCVLGARHLKAALGRPVDLPQWIRGQLATQ